MATIRTGVMALLAVLATAGCDSGGGGGPVVTITYEASTTLDPLVALNQAECVNAVRGTHIHPSWRGYARYNLEKMGSDLWLIDMGNMPVGERVRFRINDPNECANNPTGATTSGISANGVALSDVVSTPGEGPEPGLAFEIDADGNVTP